MGTDYEHNGLTVTRYVAWVKFEYDSLYRD